MKFSEFKSINVVLVLCIALFIKILAVGIGYADCLGALVIFAAIHGDVVVRYLFPKRVDLYEEVETLRKGLVDLNEKVDRTDSDVTALKFGSTKR